MAQTLLADGRAEDVVRMIEPLLARSSDSPPSEDGSFLRALLARVHTVHTGDVDYALDLLAPFEDVDVRTGLPPRVRAHVTLWLGWAHARRDETFDEEARALNLLDEAHRLFESEWNPTGRCWTLLGQAKAYFTIDEYQLMRQALDDAAALQRTLGDVQATRWFHDLSVPACRFRGRYDDAQQHIDELYAWGETHRNRAVKGRAMAYQAALYLDQGHPPERIVDTARRAETLLRDHPGQMGYPLLAAYHAHIRALLLQGEWDAADRSIQHALQQLETYPTARAHLQTLRARWALRQKRTDEAAACMDQLFEQAHRLPHGLQRSHVALLRGDLLSRMGQHDDAQTWMERAYQNARETGHRGNQLQALLAAIHAALQAEQTDRADDLLAQTERYEDYFSVLPFAAQRFQVVGHRARLDGRFDDAQTAYNQALSAYALIGDAGRRAHMQCQLAALRTDHPAQARTLLEAAIRTFERLGQPADADAARTQLASLPDDADTAPPAFETTIGESLARASLSTRLVAEAWIQAVEQLLPGRWIGVYRCTDQGDWACVHEHGVPPAQLAYPAPSGETTQPVDDVRWHPLYVTDDLCFHLALSTTEVDDATWDEALDRLRPWLPVVRLALDRALLRRQRLSDLADPPPDTTDTSRLPDDFIHESPPLRAVAQRIVRMRASHSPVLITGERGTGKTAVARAIHATSKRHSGPWHAINCASVPPDPLAARLFGQPASEAPGLFEQANGGTIFLQNIDALPAALQARLTRVLEAGEVVRPGTDTPLPVDVRVLASTPTDLAARVRAGTFRDDLYYRLHVISLHVPPLRERPADIPPLARHFANTLPPTGTPPVSITNHALEALLRYDWPGNVRQLRNEIERALVFVTSEPAPTIDRSVLSAPIRTAVPAPAPPPDEDWNEILHPERDLDDVLARTEKEIIERVLAECDGQITGSADMLGLTRQGLYKKMKRLGIDASDFKPAASATAVAS